NNLKSSAAGIETRLFKGPNQLTRFVNVYLNDEDIRFLKNLDTPVKEGDEISIIPAIAGGACHGRLGRALLPSPPYSGERVRVRGRWGGHSCPPRVDVIIDAYL